VSQHLRGDGGQPQQPPYEQQQQYGQQAYLPPYAYGPGRWYPAPYPEQKSRLVAGLLGVLLGGLGIHRFYLGHVGMGIAQLIVTILTFGLGMVWGFIEGIMILAGAPVFRADARGIPLKE
jgi:TM2 domain-containing membrane protein YozV